ncbi:MAG: hypothetical protein OXI79_00030 [Gammaproteobacteria bacterium]|nr:hypothetical protein [Gammaproteobacteria bacterium]
MERRAAQGAGAERDRGGQRLPRTIRFTEHDWDRIETFAVMRGMTAAELVRTATLAAVGTGPAVAGSDRGLARQVERIFRYTHILATALRNEMIGNGRGEELEELVRSARALLAELQDGPSD